MNELENVHQQLEHARDRYAELFDFSATPLLIVDGSGIIRAVSEAAMALFAVGRIKLLGLTLASLAIEGDRPMVRKHIQRCRRSTVPVVTEVTLALPLGAIQLVQMTSRRVGGQREAYLTSLAAQTAGDAKDRFISVLGHELRAPLTAMEAVAAALEREDVSGDQRLDLAQVLRRNTTAQSRLVDDLMDVTRVVRRKMKVDRQLVDLHALVREALETMMMEIEARNLEITVALEAEQHHVMGDRLRLGQVFWNLLHNATKFTSPGGKITLRSWNRQGRIVVEVEDDGAGIETAVLAQIFLPFEQVVSTGSPLGLGLGLGLAITKGIVELHDGLIAAVSPGPGRGSKFLVELAVQPSEPPAAELPGTAVVAAATPQQASALGRRILMVEDNADIARLLADELRRAGYQVDISSSVTDALGKDLEKVDLVLSDVKLPDGSGLDLLRRLRAHPDARKHLVAVALSGYASPKDVRASVKAGFFAHLKKPVDRSELLSVIAAAIRQ